MPQIVNPRRESDPEIYATGSININNSTNTLNIAQSGTYQSMANHTYTIPQTSITSAVLGGAAQSMQIKYEEPERTASLPWTKVTIESQGLGEETIEIPSVRRMIFADVVLAKCGKFHWDVFTKLHPSIEYFSVGIAQQKATQVIATSIGFHREEDYQVFKRWYDAKLELFVTLENLYTNRFPQPPSVLEGSAYVKMPNRVDCELAIWLEENCVDPVYAISDVFIFTNTDDAVLFKLKYTGVDNKTKSG